MEFSTKVYQDLSLPRAGRVLSMFLNWFKVKLSSQKTRIDELQVFSSLEQGPGSPVTMHQSPPKAPLLSHCLKQRTGQPQLRVPTWNCSSEYDGKSEKPFPFSVWCKDILVASSIFQCMGQTLRREIWVLYRYTYDQGNQNLLQFHSLPKIRIQRWSDQ